MRSKNFIAHGEILDDGDKRELACVVTAKLGVENHAFRAVITFDSLGNALNVSDAFGSDYKFLSEDEIREATELAEEMYASDAGYAIRLALDFASFRYVLVRESDGGGKLLGLGHTGLAALGQAYVADTPAESNDTLYKIPVALADSLESFDCSEEILKRIRAEGERLHSIGGDSK